ncbi:hypothetical protein INT48_007120 [Thamnidium elegans]|uniref:DUF202 domain-containing protein n=1 Tax=Thamnidium elegans TaxID=101142 RepID=A0A8H7ST50_9FUNG|nr:hypothetical protein INT48_007120 [Thamnidium elegans]
MSDKKEKLIRGHRRESALFTLPELQDLRGAYWRTALAAFSSGLLILKVFTREFYKIGITFFVFGLAMLAIALWRRRTSFDVFDQSIPYKTSGDWVILTTIVTMATYIVLLILLWNL